MSKSILAALVLSGACLIACSSSSPSLGSKPCNEDPWQCSAGQTCWPTVAGTFACLNSGAGAFASPCQDTLGVPTCGDGLACVQSSASNGVCTKYCDNTDVSHACPSGLACETAELLTAGGAQTHLCFGGAVVAGAGDSGASNGTDASTSEASVDSGGTADSGTPDSGAADSGATDSGTGDSATVDGGGITLGTL